MRLIEGGDGFFSENYYIADSIRDLEEGLLEELGKRDEYIAQYVADLRSKPSRTINRKAKNFPGYKFSCVVDLERVNHEPDDDPTEIPNAITISDGTGSLILNTAPPDAFLFHRLLAPFFPNPGMDPNLWKTRWISRPVHISCEIEHFDHNPPKKEPADDFELISVGGYYIPKGSTNSLPKNLAKQGSRL